MHLSVVSLKKSPSATTSSRLCRPHFIAPLPISEKNIVAMVMLSRLRSTKFDVTGLGRTGSQFVTKSEADQTHWRGATRSNGRR
jgi:hypothetical protein